MNTFESNFGLRGMINITHMWHIYGPREDLRLSERSLRSGDGLRKAQGKIYLKKSIKKYLKRI